ncbi:hypothetical protein HDU96_009441 [Phlyctochytrium bullatum]|nr:hypothetical protein HDU96_009441 [Phlyctochytrium bullatum]
MENNEKAVKEVKLLKQRIEVLEKENAALKKSLYDLSARFNMLAPTRQALPLVLDSGDVAEPGIDSLLIDSSKLPGSNLDEYPADAKRGREGRFFYLKSDMKICALWDVEAGKNTEVYEAEGFVQCVALNPSDNKIFFYGTSRNCLGIVDRRKGSETTAIIRNDSMVNAIYVVQDGSQVITGDSFGFLKTWDVRTMKCISAVQNEPTRKPISHIAVCPSHDERDEDRYLGVNCYDNVLRVYDRGISLPQTQQRVIQSFRGYKNKNWPIKSSFYRPREVYSVKRSTSNDEVYRKKDLTSEVMADMVSEKLESDVISGPLSASSSNSLLLATGSADPYVYVYSLNIPEVILYFDVAKWAKNTGELIQKVEGHSDRVYCASFHPTEPIMASCSADFTVKLWYSRKKK